MRLWSLHPCYLDTKGLVALWREGLLARHVLLGNTKGYRSHPQLIRFKEHPEPVKAIDTYLAQVLKESLARGYRFDASKITPPNHCDLLTVSQGQLAYEWQHLKQKLQQRSMADFDKVATLNTPEPHPLFTIVPGDIAPWEKV